MRSLGFALPLLLSLVLGDSALHAQGAPPPGATAARMPVVRVVRDEAGGVRL